MRKQLPQGAPHHRRLALGTRQRPESEVANKPLLNHVRSAGLNVLTRLIFPDLATLSDTQASCKLMTLALARAILAGEDSGPPFLATGIEADVEILQLARFYGGDLQEVPITFIEDSSTPDNLGLGVGADLVSALLALRTRVPDLAQRPLLIPHGAGAYTVQRLGSGTEHMVFKLESPHRPPLVVKIPHEAIDPDFYLRLEALWQNAGWGQPSDRTSQHGLIIHNPVVQGILSADNARLREWIYHLRNWPDLNALVLKLIRVYERKSFKSAGYRYGLDAGPYVAPFHFLAPDEVVRIRLEAAPGREYVFDGLDNVLVMPYLPCTIKQYLRGRCAEARRAYQDAPEYEEVVTTAFSTAISTAFAFAGAMAGEACIYDIDMNLWDDIGLTSAVGDLNVANLRLLDPGELETLSSEHGRAQCLRLLQARLGMLPTPPDVGSLHKAIAEIDYSSNFFRAFQFKQLDIYMSQYQLSPAARAQIHDQCVASVRAYLTTLLSICGGNVPTGSMPRPVPGNVYWCISQKTPDDERAIAARYRAQIAAVMYGGDVQGQFHRIAHAGCIDDLSEFAVFAAQRGIASRFSKRGVAIGASPLPGGDLWYLGRKEVAIYRGAEKTATLPIPVDPHQIPYRGALVPIIHAIADSRPDQRPQVVILDAGIGARMSLIGLAEGAKGRLHVDQGIEVWQQAAASYGALAHLIQERGRADLIVFGASDTVFQAAAQNRFFEQIADYFAGRDPAGWQPGVFLLQPPGVEGTPLIPYSSGERAQWLLRLLRGRSEAVAPFMPIAAPLLSQAAKIKDIKFAGLEGQAETRLPQLPLFDLVKQSASRLLRFELIADAIARYSGLRLPFLFVLSQQVIDLLQQQFFGKLAARCAQPLDWYNTLVLGFSTIAEADFAALHSQWLDAGQARQLYQLLQRIKHDFLGVYHLERSAAISASFYQERAADTITWRVFESPVDLLNYYRETRVPTVREIGGNIVQIHSDILDPARISVTPAAGAVGKEFAIVIAGNLPEDLHLNLELQPPTSDLAKRSNLYPYLVYFAASAAQASTREWNITLAAHQLCVVEAKDSGAWVSKVRLASPTRQTALDAIIDIWDGTAWWQTTLRQRLLEPG